MAGVITTSAPSWIPPFTGLSPRAFGKLVTVLRREGADAVRRGRPWSLPLEDRALLVAAYWRTNLTMRQLAPLFGVSESAADRIIDHLGPMLALQPRKRFAKDTVLIVDGTLAPTRDHTAAERGVDVPALGTRIHPHYGVFAPVRAEYVDLVAHTPLPTAARNRPSTSTAFDLGTGTGVLAAVLAHRGIQHIVATDISPRALACARDNVHRLALTNRIEVTGPGLFPEGRADLIVCDPPWIPARPAGPIEQSVYDPDSTMLHGFLAGLSDRLRPGGEGWLILSDLAEHLGIRTRQQLLEAIQAAHLRIVDKIDTKPRHPRAKDATDPLYTARSAETTSLWRLTA